MSTSQPTKNVSVLTDIQIFFTWTDSSAKMMSAFILLLFIIGYAWWPLVAEYISLFDPSLSIWSQIDWLLIGNFAVMSVLMMAKADIRKDLPIIIIGLFGGLIIEAWGTQTELWTYYTNERPPLWIVPAWPIASLSIDRLYRLIKIFIRQKYSRYANLLYYLSLSYFFWLMIPFVAPTIQKSLTVFALVLSILTVVSIKNREDGLLVFIAGSGLGYFLELWGTTRECWVYYTHQTPPLFAVLAHGMAALVFWRIYIIGKKFLPKWFT